MKTKLQICHIRFTNSQFELVLNSVGGYYTLFGCINRVMGQQNINCSNRSINYDELIL